MKRRVRGALSVSCAATLAALVAGCAGGASPEDEVRAVIEAAERAVEARDVSAAMALVSERYADAGGRDRRQLRDFLRGWFVLNQSIHLLVRVENLEFPADGLARARIVVGSIGRRDGEDWSLAADLQELDVELLREGDDWRLVRADRVRPEGAAF